MSERDDWQAASERLLKCAEGSRSHIPSEDFPDRIEWHRLGSKAAALMASAPDALRIDLALATYTLDADVDRFLRAVARLLREEEGTDAR